YSLDQSDSTKRKKCRNLIKSLTDENSGAISTQVLQELYVAATAKFGADPLLVKDIIRSLERLETVVVSPTLIKEAIDCSIINRLSFWDALIVVTAESAHCEILWTEDLKHGQVIRGVCIENPLK
ncbi:MAG: PIN domain-containing protein, partial [Desulfobacterales bacterium]